MARPYQHIVTAHGGGRWLIQASTPTTGARATLINGDVVAVMGHSGDLAVARGGVIVPRGDEKSLVPGDIRDWLVEASCHTPRGAWEELWEELHASPEATAKR